MAWEGYQGVMVCDGCSLRFEPTTSPTRAVALMEARAKGWHCYEGFNQGGGAVLVHLCKDCIGTNRSKLPAPPPRLDEDEPLF